MCLIAESFSDGSTICHREWREDSGQWYVLDYVTGERYYANAEGDQPDMPTAVMCGSSDNPRCQRDG